MVRSVYTIDRVGKTVPTKRRVLKDIDLPFLPFAKVGVLGPNGPGRSTLLEIAARLDNGIEGDVGRCRI